MKILHFLEKSAQYSSEFTEKNTVLSNRSEYTFLFVFYSALFKIGHYKIIFSIIPK